MGNGMYFVGNAGLSKAAIASVVEVLEENNLGMCEVHKDTPVRPVRNRRENRYVNNHGGNVENIDLPGVKLICPECYKVYRIEVKEKQKKKEEQGSKNFFVSKKMEIDHLDPLWQ